MAKAKKDYRCVICGGAIPAGSFYEPWTLKPWDHPDNDGFYTARLHAGCDEWARDQAGNYTGEDGWTFDMLREDWLETKGNAVLA